MSKIVVTCMNAADRLISQSFIDLMYSGDPHSAFNMINRRVSATCRAACHSAGVRNAEDQEDIAQRALIELFKTAWTKYDGTCSIFTYLYTIARRRALDLVRHRARQLGDVSEESSINPDEVDSANNEHRLCASKAMEEFEAEEPRYWEILSAWILSGESVESLAGSLGIKSGSLKNLITKIKRYLSELCLKHCGTADCSALVTG